MRKKIEQIKIKIKTCFFSLGPCACARKLTKKKPLVMCLCSPEKKQSLLEKETQRVRRDDLMIFYFLLTLKTKQETYLYLFAHQRFNCIPLRFQWRSTHTHLAHLAPAPRAPARAPRAPRARTSRTSRAHLARARISSPNPK